MVAEQSRWILSGARQRSEDESFVGAQVDLLAVHGIMVVEVSRKQRFGSRFAGPQDLGLIRHVERDQQPLIAEPTLVSEHVIGGADKPESADGQRVVVTAEADERSIER